MPDIQCWHCGSEIEEKGILGVGKFTLNIGRLTGKGFIAFNCEDCEEIRYQILSSDHELLNSGSERKLASLNISDFIPPEKIELNQVIDFHKKIEDIDTVEKLIKKCDNVEDFKTELLHRPFNRNDDLIELFEQISDYNRKRAMIIILDKNRYLRSWELMGPGTGQEISFEPRNIFSQALQFDFKTMVYLVDNLNNNSEEKPSHKEIVAVKRLIKAGKILGVPFKDKLVVSDDNFISYKSLNLI